MTAPLLYTDAPIAGPQFDALGRAAVATRLVELVTTDAEQPIVIGLVAPAGAGKTSVLRMTGELCAARADLRAFALDCWVASDAAKVNDELLQEVTTIFETERVVGNTEKARERLFAVGDVVSAVARFAGAKVDVRGGLERSPDKLREEVMKHTEATGKRIVVLVDHLDRMPPADAVTVLKLVARWGTFPYFAFVVAYDRDALARKLRRIDGNADDLDRVMTTELALPPVERAVLAAWLRGNLADLARARSLDPAPALALFELETGAGLPAIATLRDAKRMFNAVSAALPLGGLDLRTACVAELVRGFVPSAYPVLVEHIQLGTDRAQLAALLAPHAQHHRRQDLAAALLATVRT